MFRLLVIFILLPVILLGENPSIPTENEILQSANTPLATIYGIPETNIFGVNVINEDYNFSSIDFDLPGADPLVLQRSYSSSNFQLRGFFHSWTHNLCGMVKNYQTKKHLHVIVSGALSGEIPFRQSLNDESQKLYINRDILRKGVTNCGHGEISGRYNLKNMEVTYWSDAIDIRNPDGTEHNYFRMSDDHFGEGGYSFLEQTIKPNGLKTIYNVNLHLLHGVASLNHKEEASNRILFKDMPTSKEFKELKKYKDPFYILGESDDGKTAKYFFDWYHKHSKIQEDTSYNLLLWKFESSHLPTEYYTYTDSYYGPEKLSDRYGARHRTSITYYKEGDRVYLPGYYPEEVSSDHIARHRVRKIEVAVNEPEDLRTIAYFAYYRNKSTKEAFTDVYNEYDHLTRFHYSTDDYRLSCVEKYKGTQNYSILRRENLCFGEAGTDLEGDLLYKTVEAPNGTIHYAENFEYDERGNVLRRILRHRTFKDFEIHPISYPEGFWRHLQFLFETGNYHPEGGEAKCISYTYNDLNLPTSEDDGKLKITFQYHNRNGKETNLLKAKLFQENNTPLKREFYEFDENAGCTLKIEDDGSGNFSDDLTNVQIRKITKFINRGDNFAGLPLEVDEWGTNGREEQRIGRIVLNYDSHGYVEKEQHYDANNQFAYEIQKIRNLRGNIICETDALGQITNRKFNIYGSLVEEHGPNLDYYTKYSYNWLQRPIKETRYCQDGIHLITIRRYDLEGRLIKIKDPYGLNTKFTYNEQGKLARILHPPVRTVKGWVIPEEQKEYNFLGHLISQTDAKGAVTLYAPNDAGLPLKITYPDNSFEEFNYSIYGEILGKRQRNGSKVAYTYDAFSRPICEKFYDQQGNLLKETSKKYSGLLLLSETDGEGLETFYTYDYAGRVSETRQGRALTKYLYDALGRVQEEQRYYKKQDYVATQFIYDSLNRVVEKIEVDKKGQIHSRESRTYDADGNVTSITEASTHAGRSKTRYTYDPRGNLSSVIDPLGNTTVYQHRYDIFFEGYNLPYLEVIDPSGVKTVTISDARGSPLCIKIFSPIGELLSHEEMYYDLQGNLVRKENYLPQETIVTLWKYDSSSRLRKKVIGNSTEEQITTRYIYNSYGELSETHYADGSSKHRTYDALGRLFEEWSEDKSIHYRYRYNRQDLLTDIENCKTQKRTIREYFPDKDLKSECFENGLKISYQYDRLHRVIECIYPDQSSIRQIYNPVFLEKVKRIKNDEVVYEATFKDFDLAGKPEKVIFPKQGGTLLIKYDRLHRPVRLLYPYYKEKDITYDERGLLTSKEVDCEIETFDHDNFGQLTLEKTARYSHTYKNDALYRQISVDGYQQIHNAVHQLKHGCHGKYDFDPKGRRVKANKASYSYDKFDRLETIEKGDQKWTYTYDAFNRKMSRTFAGHTVYYLYDGNEEIGSFSRKQECYDLKVLSASEGSFPIAIELGKELYTPIISSQGHIVGLADVETGEIADRSPLTMFGKDLSKKPLSPWRFCGKRHEAAELGIIDFGYRHYHPKSAQWLTQDPLGENDGPNFYAYVSNTPTRCMDRFGLFTEDYSFSSSWKSLTERCSRIESQIADYTINSPRFTGALQVLGGIPQVMAGTGMAAAGVAGTSTGFGAPLGVPTTCAGAALTFSGYDDIVTGAKQFWTGEYQDSLKVQLLETVGFSKSTATIADIALSMGGGFASKGAKMFSSLPSRIPKSLPLKLAYKPFTKNNYRHNLMVYTGINPGRNFHAHHVFPQKYRGEFAKRGINIDDPIYLVWWNEGSHLKNIPAYDKFWHATLFEETTPLMKEQLLEAGRNLMKNRYEMNVNF